MAKLLVPTDFSPGSAAAARYGFALAGDLRCELELMHAYHADSAGGSLIDVEEHMEAGVHQDYEEFYEGLRADVPSGLAVHRRTERRRPDAAVERVLKLEGDEVIALVMGARGETAAERVFAGSTTQKVIDEVAHPVFAVPQDFVGATVGPRRILWAVDGDTDPGRRGLDLVRTLAMRAGGALTFYYGGGAGELPEGRLHHLAGPAEYTSITERDADDASAGIIAAAERIGADLIAVTHGKGGFFSRVFGRSTTGQTLRHSRVPVLVLPRADKDA